MAADSEELFKDTSPLRDPLSVVRIRFPVTQALSQFPQARVPLCLMFRQRL